jgi:formylglycine-generating enzyme required for sulfatase activity
MDWQKRYNGLLCLELIGSDKAKEIVSRLSNDSKREIAEKANELMIHWGRIRPEKVIEKDRYTGFPKRFYHDLEYGMEYILIPGGTYIMGELKKQIAVEPFYMAKFTVTNKHYRNFIKTTKHEEPTFWDDRRFNGDEQPVVGVSWSDAVAYYEWLTKNSKRKIGKFYLPSEEEWEWAAGSGKRRYPWGDTPEPNKNLANFDNNVGQTTPVGSYPKGATPEGLMDMAGNVWEWTGSVHEAGKEWRVIRGGSFYSASVNLRCSSRNGLHRDLPWYYYGFRVACFAQSGNL